MIASWTTEAAAPEVGPALLQDEVRYRQNAAKVFKTLR
ncbi:hypothetical protein FB004_11589 [Sinorhizobium medicae]|nr:hypothetical protein FB004_11589 [Sinorhizobium medicae]TWA18062.1 hypothetical protein FB006_12089 [Sinorhizobium medicae]TWA29773.1 hypothetical protein FB007_11989 [Sinorhizobium medicae]TWA33840.1 hypothetical protein FB009_11838 [Sinorhizobium medicae]TWA38382.1 hypothetical protein FB005_11889 [Sinorhizobium medicae]